MQIFQQLVSSLEKVFPDRAPADQKSGMSALQGETISFQWALRLEEEPQLEVNIHSDSPLAHCMSLYAVGCVPSLLPKYPDSDDWFLRNTPGVFPDVLSPCQGKLQLVGGQWRSLWVEVTLPADIPAGIYPIRLLLTAANGEKVSAEATFQLEVIGICLPPQTLQHTEWFHADCLAQWYRVPIFSEEHWSIMESYLKNAVRYGINTLLTPVFTPPLDTAVGAERPTVQLVDVWEENGRYTFGFERLKRYTDMALRCGIRYFEISHLFTQWGAKHAPKIVVTADQQEKRFGWHTDAASPEYVTFLHQFLTELKAYLRRENLFDRCWFHISDEPELKTKESYRLAQKNVRDILADCRTRDAVSDISFYREGIVPCPIPSNDHIETFIAEGIPHLWTYYCCGQTKEVSNRMMAMPSVRNRILGWQLYRYQIEGFLHWGYNYWFTALAKQSIDPYAVTDAGEVYPSGDAFLVYPGQSGQPIPSIRQLIFHEALQDMQALQLLETLIGRQCTEEWIDREFGEKLTFRTRPETAQKLMQVREKLNRMIQNKIQAKTGV